MIRERTLREGTEAHYRDPRYYDQTYRRRRGDVRYYVAQARRFGGPVLELGVGTGRVALALARSGFDVLGVDRSEPMLAHARARAEKLPRAARERLVLEAGDLRTFRAGGAKRARGARLPKGGFPLVIAPFNVFMHLYTREDVEAALATAKAHLGRDGRLVFDVLLPYPDGLARDPLRLYRAGHVTRPDDGKRYRYSESFEYDPASQVQIVRMFFEDEGDDRRTLVTPLAHRQFFPAELEALLHYNGFAIEERFGGFEGEPLDRGAESQVIVARRVTRARARRSNT